MPAQEPGGTPNSVWVERVIILSSHASSSKRWHYVRPHKTLTQFSCFSLHYFFVQNFIVKKLIGHYFPVHNFLVPNYLDQNEEVQKFLWGEFSLHSIFWYRTFLYRFFLLQNCAWTYSPRQNFPVQNFLCMELSWTEFSLYRIFSGQNFPGSNFLDRIIQKELFAQNFSCSHWRLDACASYSIRTNSMYLGDTYTPTNLLMRLTMKIA